VIVVGNVIAGGSGKTPVVMALVRHLTARGLQVGVVSRGYGRTIAGKADACREVLPDSTPAETGDEPLMVRRSTGAPVFVGRRRADAAAALIARHPEVQVIVCDDGLQHAALQRDVEICVFDDRGVGNGWLLPAGPLREPWPRPVDLVLHTGVRPAFEGFRAVRQLAAYAVRQDGSRVPLADLRSKPVMAVAAIAQPQAFFDMLQHAGMTLASTEARPDHDDFANWSPPEGAPPTILCTEKDAAKIWRRAPQALAVPLEVTLEDGFLLALDARLDRIMPGGIADR
jgi:tetraacyldisaccharide 4'-kinase